ncbi:MULTISPECIES: HAD-IA family hydrolase [Aphanothece]|uniref:HAD-IA family hydrolase n=1 Tax=Aphanothece TaxID=1121 RepID=UPI0039851B18
MSLRALLWDVDGTLAETERDGHRVAFNRAFAERGVGVHWDPDGYRHWLRISGGAERIRACLAELEGQDPEPARVAALQACKQRHYGALVRDGLLRLRLGVAALITEAAAAGLSQGLVTTSARGAVQELEHRLLGDLAQAFSFRICGEDVRRKKPDAEAYRLALAHLGLPARQVVAIEDSPQGLAAAVGAELPCLVTLSHYGAQMPAEHYQQARAVVSELGEGCQVLNGPACQSGRVTLSYLEDLL